MEYNINKNEILLDKQTTNLDRFSLKFLGVISKYTSYVIIAGYVSILLGRTRVTEGIDVFIKRIPREVFFDLYDNLEEEGFWCLNTDEKERAFEYLESNYAIRFAKKNQSIPNFEVKFPKDDLDEAVFDDFIKVVLPDGDMVVSSLERHIAFKKYFLGSDKDNEDALHIEELFKDKINYGKINKIKYLIEKRKLS